MLRAVLLFYRLLSALAALAMLATFFFVMLGVIARIAGWDLPGLDAYAGYAIAAGLFLALPSTLKRGDHIRVTLVLDRLPVAGRSVMEWWSLLAAFGLSLYVSWYSVRLVWVSYEMHDVSPAADATPLWIPQLAMALGSIGLALAFAHALLARRRGENFIEESDEASHVE